MYEDGHAKKVSITGLGYKWEYSNLKGKKKKRKRRKRSSESYNTGPEDPIWASKSEMQVITVSRES